MENVMITRSRRVLIVDDEEQIHRDFEEILNIPKIVVESDKLAVNFEDQKEEDEELVLDIELLHAMSGEEAFEIVKNSVETGNRIALVFMDIRMPGWDGIETICRIRQIDQDIEVVIVTAYTDKPLPKIARTVGLAHKTLYLRKPFTREEVQQITLALVEKWNVEMELAERNIQLRKNEQILKKELKDALSRMLDGFLPICAECKKIRDDNGNWHQIDVYIQRHTGTRFTYSICPECRDKLYPELKERIPILKL